MTMVGVIPHIVAWSIQCKKVQFDNEIKHAILKWNTISKTEKV